MIQLKISKQTFVLSLLFLLAAFFRLYRIQDTLMFQSDQGRDAIIAKRILKDGDITLLGPVMSVGNVYLGPFYYYFMVPFLALSYPNPVGPAIGVALVGIATVVLLWFFTRDLLDTKSAWIATMIYTFWPVAVEYSRFSWNPNIAPFFSLVILYSLYKIHTTGKLKYLWFTFISSGILIQLHYIAMLMFPIMGLSLLWTLRQRRSKKLTISIIAGSLLAIGMVTIPILVFDFTHHFIISSSFFRFFTSKEEFIRPPTKIIDTIRSIEGRFFLIITQMITHTKNIILDRVMSYGVFLLTLYYGFKELYLTKRYGLVLILATIVTGIIGISLLTTAVFDHYILYLLPMIAMLYGWLGSRIISTRQLNQFIIYFLLILFVSFSFSQLPTFKPLSGVPMSHYQQVAKAIEPYTDTNKYNLALISETRDYKAMNYRYFLEISQHPPAHPDQIFDLKKLIIIDELGVDNPLSQPPAEIAHPATYLHQITNKLEIENGPKVYIVE